MDIYFVFNRKHVYKHSRPCKNRGVFLEKARELRLFFFRQSGQWYIIITDGTRSIFTFLCHKYKRKRPNKVNLNVNTLDKQYMVTK